jgi:hypothetical protein
LPIKHFLRCMVRRSLHRFSQIFPAHKTSTLRFHRYRSHILQKPPLVPRLGLHHPSPKVGITPSFLSAPNIRETGKITCYLTKPTHISPVFCMVHMVTRSTNRSRLLVLEVFKVNVFEILHRLALYLTIGRPETSNIHKINKIVQQTEDYQQYDAMAG